MDLKKYLNIKGHNRLIGCLGAIIIGQWMQDSYEVGAAAGIGVFIVSAPILALLAEYIEEKRALRSR